MEQCSAAGIFDILAIPRLKNQVNATQFLLECHIADQSTGSAYPEQVGPGEEAR
jgi:hypothetical protein